MLKNISKKRIIITLAVIVSVTCAVSGTLAYILSRTPPIENSFETVQVSCSVEEELNGTTKSNVKVKNTSSINAYVRATFIVMWTSENGSVTATSPVLGTDYTVAFGSAKWSKGSDGFYYYSDVLTPDALTENLINTISVIGEAPEGYTLSVHVAATAIQATPATVVTDTWGATVNQNGTLSAP